MVGQVREFSAQEITIADLLTALNTYKDSYLWVEANGDEYKASEHPIAALVLGTYDNGGITMIAVPDTAALAGVGVGSHTDANGETKVIGGGVVYGSYNHKLTIPEIPAHAHSYETISNPENFGRGSIMVGASGRDEERTGSVGENEAHENMQPSLGMHYVVALDKI